MMHPIYLFHDVISEGYDDPLEVGFFFYPRDPFGDEPEVQIDRITERGGKVVSEADLDDRTMQEIEDQCLEYGSDWWPDRPRRFNE